MLQEYLNDRNDAITECIDTDSLDAFKAFVSKWVDRGVYPKCFILPSDEVLNISIRQMCLHVKGIEPETKGKAVEWLTSHNCHLDIE